MSLKGKPSSSVRPREPVLIFTDTLFLLMAVMGTIYAFCGAYSLVPGRGVLLSGLVASLLFAAVFSMPRFRWIPLALFAGLSAVAVWKLWPQLRRGAYAVYTSVANVLAEWFSVDLIELPDTLSAAEWQGVRNLFLSAAVIVLALMLGWTVVRLHSALLTMVLTLSPLLPGLLFEAPPPWPALMTLAACWLALLFTAQLRGKPQNGAGRFALLALPACVLLVCLLSTAFPQETYSHPQWALNAYLRLTDWGARFFNGIFPGGPAVGQQCRRERQPASIWAMRGRWSIPGKRCSVSRQKCREGFICAVFRLRCTTGTNGGRSMQMIMKRSPKQPGLTGPGRRSRRTSLFLTMPGGRCRIG